MCHCSLGFRLNNRPYPSGQNIFHVVLLRKNRPKAAQLGLGFFGFRLAGGLAFLGLGGVSNNRFNTSSSLGGVKGFLGSDLSTGYVAHRMSYPHIIHRFSTTYCI